MKLVKIVWYDAFSDSCWYDKEEITAVEAVRCESVGYIVSENDREIKLCHTISDSDLLLGRLIIPKGMIRETKELNEK